MKQIGEYPYPSEVTFAQTLEIAKETLITRGGFMPNLEVGQKLGYKLDKPNGVPGFVFKKFDEMAMFGLFAKERGGIRSTPLAKEALDDIDRISAKEGKAKAVRNITIVKKAFDEWKGEIPIDTAFQTKLADLAGVKFNDAQIHVAPVKRLISECFPYLKERPDMRIHSTICLVRSGR